jgi:TPR repeat protein
MTFQSFLRTPGFRLLVAGIVVVAIIATCDRTKEQVPVQSEQRERPGKVEMPKVESSGDSPSRSLELLQNIALKGDLNAQIRLGDFAYQQERFEEAFSWYVKAAEQGDAGAQASLAYMYAYGLGVRADSKQATLWAQAAAAQGSPVAKQLLTDVLPK